MHAYKNKLISAYIAMLISSFEMFCLCGEIKFFKLHVLVPFDLIKSVAAKIPGHC